MLDLYELKQLVAFSDMGTLSKIAEEFHISTPSVTRSMQSLEDSLGVPLFTRSKNRITLNENGYFAVECARKLLSEAEDTVRQIRAFDARQKTIAVKSCAPAPLWELLKKLSGSHPQMTISSGICQNDEVLSAWEDGSCDIAILPFPISDEKGTVQKYMEEHLFVYADPAHELAKYTELTFAEINGFNFLLRSELGFWDALCRQKMPASKFLVQKEEFAFRELVSSSSLPCFITDYALRQSSADFKRISIPITDGEANVTFYIAVSQNCRISCTDLLHHTAKQLPPINSHDSHPVPL